MNNITKHITYTLFICIIILLLPVFQVFASTYGYGTYGGGQYGEGDVVPSPVPSPTLSPAVSPTPSTAPSPTIGPAPATGCSMTPPGARAPWLYGAIPMDAHSILLYFTEADEPTTGYALQYGKSAGNYQYGAEDLGVNERGQMTYLVRFLAPNTQYYFQVRAKNDCAPGPWSNEISAKTKGFISLQQLSIVESTLKTSENVSKTELDANALVSETDENIDTANDACTTYTVVEGDTLSSIAEDQLQDASKYKTLIDLNKETYPSLESTANIDVGWKLTTHCNQKEQDDAEKTNEAQQTESTGYKVSLTILDDQKTPIQGAKVTIHSNVQESLSDENGVVKFENVEKGNHKILISFNNYEGEQSIDVSGNVDEQAITIVVKEKNIMLSFIIYIGIGVAIGVVATYFFFRRMKNQQI